MLDTNEAIYRQYETLGISKEVLDFGTSVEKELKERFDKIDTNAEYNQLKVIAAMQKNKVSAECFQASSGYGYNDLGRDTLERVYADCFGAEDALVRPQITCGTHALALALMSNLRPGDELLSPDAAQRILAELKKSITSKSKGAPSRMRLCCVCALRAR